MSDRRNHDEPEVIDIDDEAVQEGAVNDAGKHIACINITHQLSSVGLFIGRLKANLGRKFKARENVY